MARNIQSHEKQGPTAETALPAKVSFRIEGQIKSFPEEKKLNEFIIIKPLLYKKLKGLIKKIKTMNNKVVENTNLSIIKSKNTASKNRIRIMDMESILMVARWEGVWGSG